MGGKTRERGGRRGGESGKNDVREVEKEGRMSPNERGNLGRKYIKERRRNKREYKQE